MTYKLTNTSQPADPYYGAVSLLLHGDGADGSTQIIDSSVNPKTVTAVGNAQISTTESKFNGSSLKFDGSGDYLSTGPDSNLALGSGDFTVEAFIYATSPLTDSTIASSRVLNVTGALYWTFSVSSTGQLMLQSRTSAGTQYFAMSATSAITTNTWYHVAGVRQSNVLTVYVNGVAGPTTANDGGNDLSESYVGVSIFNFPNYKSYFSGYIDDLRITKGVARYTSNFTPPTQPFLSTSNIVIDNLVLNLDAAAYGGSGTTWSDSSGNGNTGTLVNGVGYDSGNEGSLTFDGVNDYVTLSSSQIAPGTGAFTWNFWAKHIPTGSGVGRYSILFSGTGSNSTYGIIYMNSDTGLGYYALGHRILDSNPAFNDEWWHIAFVGNGGPNGARTLKLYRNGVQAGSTYTYNYSFTSTTPLIGANHSSFAELMRGNISNVLYYNRELTESEIQQNYNALKGRFGL